MPMTLACRLGCGLPLLLLPTLHAAAVEPPDTATGATDTTKTTLDAIIVLGAGQSRQVQTIKPAELTKAAPGTSPLASLSKLPGVNFQSSDPLGGYEWAQQITIRGFSTDQMGYTLDGVPLGNMQYRNNNGLSIGRALQAENNGPVTLSQGSAAVGTASTSNIGGTIDFTSIDPSERFGVDLAQTVGSSNNLRSFARLNSGTLPGGGRLYLSASHQQADKWKGSGSQQQKQFNLKYVQPLSDSITATTFIDGVDRREDDYLDVSLDLIRRLGYRVDNISNDFALAERLALAVQNGTPAPAPYRNGDDVYYNGGGVRKDLFAYQKFDYDLSAQLSGQTTAYWHRNHGIGTFASPYDPTPAAFGGSPISVSTVGYDIQRKGILSQLELRLDRHTLRAGLWYETTRFDQIARLYGLQAGSAPRNFQRFYDNPFRTRWHYLFDTDVYQLHVGDSWEVSDALRVDLGLKSLQATSTASTITSSQPIDGRIKASDHFLPSASALYRFDERNEAFIDYTRNMSTFVASAASGPFSTTKAGFDYIRDSLKPEKTDTVELGFRHTGTAVQTSITGYHVRFQNRLLASSISAAVVGNQNVLQNVGAVTSQGLETAATWNFLPRWSLYGSSSYNDAHYDDDVVLPGSAVVATRDKQVVGSARVLANIQLGYDDGAAWTQISAHFTGKRYYSYLNDQPIAGATVVNAGCGYRFRAAHGYAAWLDGTDVDLNVTNLLDKRYIASLGTSGFVTSDPSGSYTTLQVGAPRQVFVSLRKHF
ncbi:TonB-dependent receptor [Xanthomonas arboricola]|uniref:TonB-dependent receptor n=1 Tax=Xanthomonas arboricola pv. guizotiae TaxID=487867 RepID=A0A2S6ZXK8_9XANT|nr:TonB-dependent receptor [Xanthomonas arboricola]PPT97662.1 TonB-dependent receptor [Xanthomonas arboricola pv. guizotiae]PPU22909.1 TonB-dependent receptor [Xanthomonas arboricola pv. guizotiae]